MSAISQFGQGGVRRPTLAELQSIVGISTIGATMHTETDNQTGAFIDTTKLATNGSRLICKSAGVGMIVAPSSSQVVRSWYCRNDAKLAAQTQTQTCCTQWFIPTCAQLQNPGYTCRTFWDSFTASRYWSNTEVGTGACAVSFTDGTVYACYNKNFPGGRAVRAFRCVTY